MYIYGLTDSGRCCVYLWTYDFWLMLCIFIELRILVRVVYINRITDSFLVRVVYIYRITDSGTCCVY